MWRILKVTTTPGNGNVVPNVNLRLKYQKMYNYKPLNLPNRRARVTGPIGQSGYYNSTNSTGLTGPQ